LIDCEAICKRELIEQVSSSSNASDLYSNGSRFKPRLGYWLTWLEILFLFTHSHRTNFGILRPISPLPLASKLFPFCRRGIRVCCWQHR